MGMDARILVVDDDTALAEMIGIVLEGEGYDTVMCPDGAQALEVFRAEQPDLVLLDLMLPGMSGTEVCRQIRGDPLLKELPVLFLTARGKDEDKIEGFRAGADDYLSKPFNMEELQLRIQAILRRVQEPEADSQVEEEPLVITAGEVTLDCRTFNVVTPTRSVLLTNVQFDLLYHLMTHAGQVFTSQQLLQDVWDYPPDTGSPELVRAHIKNLRDKIEPGTGEPIYVRTIQGHGYTFSTAISEPADSTAGA